LRVNNFIIFVGWGDEITWVQTYEEGLYQAKKSNKPLMVIHHLEDCQYCQGNFDFYQC
ncbi:hypothetical protein CIB84_012728, partial [Bambusicola thoracicus]